MGVGGWVFRIESTLMFPIRVNSPAKVLEPKCHSYDICGHASRVWFVIGLSNQTNNSCDIFVLSLVSAINRTIVVTYVALLAGCGLSLVSAINRTWNPPPGQMKS